MMLFLPIVTFVLLHVKLVTAQPAAPAPAPAPAPPEQVYALFGKAPSYPNSGQLVPGEIPEYVAMSFIFYTTIPANGKIIFTVSATIFDLAVPVSSALEVYGPFADARQGFSASAGHTIAWQGGAGAQQIIEVSATAQWTAPQQIIIWTPPGQPGKVALTVAVHSTFLTVRTEDATGNVIESTWPPRPFDSTEKEDPPWPPPAVDNTPVSAGQLKFDQMKALQPSGCKFVQVNGAGWKHRTYGPFTLGACEPAFNDPSQSMILTCSGSSVYASLFAGTSCQGANLLPANFVWFTNDGSLCVSQYTGFQYRFNIQGCPTSSSPPPATPASPAPATPASPATPAAPPSAPSPSDVADVVGDPITYYNGVKTEFWLPLGELTPVMKMPDLEIFASTFQGYGQEQWMDRVVVKTPQKETVVDVRIRRDLLEFDKAESLPGNFQTLDVYVDWAVTGPAMALTERPPADVLFTHWRGLNVGMAPFRSSYLMPEHQRWYVTHIGDAQREGVMVRGDYGKVVISSISAAEFYGGGTELSVKYAHLDFSFLDMKNEHTFTGILPELWGIRPLTEKTRLLMKAPQSPSLQNTSLTELPSRTEKTLSLMEVQLNDTLPSTTLVGSCSPSFVT